MYLSMSLSLLSIIYIYSFLSLFPCFFQSVRKKHQIIVSNTRLVVILRVDLDHYLMIGDHRLQEEEDKGTYMNMYMHTISLLYLYYHYYFLILILGRGERPKGVQLK